MKYNRKRSCIPVTVGMLCYSIYSILWLIWEKNAAPTSNDQKLIKWYGIGALIVLFAGTIGGIVFEIKYLEKKLTEDQLFRLDAYIAAVWVVLMFIITIVILIKIQR
jgi:hypothetical protein